MPEQGEEKKVKEVAAEKMAKPPEKEESAKGETAEGKKTGPKETGGEPRREGKAEAEEKSEEKTSKSQKKRKKISRMTLSEVDEELAHLPEKMGGFQSAFAQHLLARKKELAESPSSLRAGRT